MSLYIPKMSDTPGVTIPGLAGNFEDLEGSQVEYGSNENGEYWRWENGLQICVPKPIIVSEGTQASLDPTESFSYPAEFSKEPILVYSIRRRGGSSLPNNREANKNIYRLNFGTAGSTTRFYLTVVEEITVSSTFSLIAIGRWK